MGIGTSTLPSASLQNASSTVSIASATDKLFTIVS